MFWVGKEGVGGVGFGGGGGVKALIDLTTFIIISKFIKCANNQTADRYISELRGPQHSLTIYPPSKKQPTGEQTRFPSERLQMAGKGKYAIR